MKFEKIKLKKDKANIVMSISMLIACAVLTAVLLIQFKTVEEVNEADIENLRETELREAISTWKSKYEETDEELAQVNAKIEEYNAKIESNEESSGLLDQELLKANLLLGNTEVTGEGVVVTIADTEECIVLSDDLLELVNELRFAGAEAISINGIRVTAMTDIVNIADRYILIKPNQRITSPYVVKAIGNQTYLESTLSLKNSGFIDAHVNIGQSVKLERQKNIIIPKYVGNFEIKYMKEVIE